MASYIGRRKFLATLGGWLCAAVFVARLLRRAASGHAAAPPSSAMNSRRLRSGMNFLPPTKGRVLLAALASGRNE
jgi:hypothetical protein